MRGACEAAKQLGSGATHVALCNNIGLYFIYLCKVLAARFLKYARTIRRKGDKFVSGKDAIARHSEVRQNRKNLADYNSKQLQKIKTLFLKQTKFRCRIGKSDLHLKTLHLNQFLARLILAG